MIKVERLSPEEMARRHAEHDAKARRAARKADGHGPTVVDMELLLSLTQARRLPWRGREYGVPPVPWRKATDLLAVAEGLAALAQGKGEDQLGAFRRLARQFEQAAKAVVVPEGRVRRALWRWWPNPFRSATHEEIGWLLGFFLSFPEVAGSWSNGKGPTPS